MSQHEKSLFSTKFMSSFLVCFFQVTKNNFVRTYFSTEFLGVLSRFLDPNVLLFSTKFRGALFHFSIPAFLVRQKVILGTSFCADLETPHFVEEIYTGIIYIYRIYIYIALRKE